MFVNSSDDFIAAIKCDAFEEIISVNWSRRDTDDQGQCFTMEIPLSTARMTFGFRVPMVYRKGEVVSIKKLSMNKYE